MMRISLNSVPVDDQDKALAFYTQVLGFVEAKNVPAGGARWLTVTSPAGPEGVELLLEPRGFDAAKTYYAALYAAGIPCTAFAVDDLDAEYARLCAAGVRFRNPPTFGTTRVAAFDDTCGNWIQLYQE